MYIQIDVIIVDVILISDFSHVHNGLTGLNSDSAVCLVARDTEPEPELA